MIRILLDKAFDTERHYIHAVGLSTDTKPTTGIITGSKFVAVDTGAGYLFDETAGEWNENQQLTEAVATYLDEHPEAIDQAAIEAIFDERLDAIEAEQGVLKSATKDNSDVLLNELGEMKARGVIVPKGSTRKPIISFDLKNGQTIRISFKLESALDKTTYLYLIDENGNYLFSGSSRGIAAGSTELVETYTPSADYKNVTLNYTVSGSASTDAICSVVIENISANVIRTKVSTLEDGAVKTSALIEHATSIDVLIDETFSNTGAQASKWFNGLLPNEQNKLYIALNAVTGVDNDVAILLKLQANYTDNTNASINITELGKVYSFTPTKTVSSYSIVGYRSNDTLQSNRLSTWAVQVYKDGQTGGIVNHNEMDALSTANNLINPKWENNTYYSSGPVYTGNRISTRPMKSPALITVTVDDGYDFSIVTFADLSYTDYSSTAWLNGKYTFQSDKYIVFCVRKRDNSNLGTDAGVHLHIISDTNNGDYLDNTYRGIKIDTNRHGLNVYKSALARTIPSGYTTQAGSIFGKYLVQGYSNSSDNSAPAYIQVFNLETSVLLFEQTINAYHFGSASFSNEYYSTDDPMPLLYVTGLNQHIYAIRVTESNATIIRDISIPTNECGYYQAAVVDAWNNLLFVFGYAAQSYQSAVDNYCIVTKYDLSNLTETGGVYKAELLETFNIPFIYCFQDFEFYKGKIFIASGYNTSVEPSSIFVFNPATKAIETTIQISAIQHEPEMIGFYATDKKDLLYYQSHSTTYTIIDFV